ncbi:MAG: low-specificity L-threonine aldolase [Anaerolineaceae bacterium]|nr:low-specificity L-threonine aldolase [Anaerolineaceae bacterium]
MWKAMASAQVGDDVYQEDPTMNQLEEIAAEITGKESALFVPSGTMGNLLAILTHCLHGDEIIIGKESHIFLDEAGGAATLGGVTSNILKNQSDGTLCLQEVEDSIRPDDIHCPRSQLIVLENTQALTGGNPISSAYTHSLANLAHMKGLKLHIDGARIFNAAIALETTVKALVESADSVTFCLSKGLCAPVGSMLCGETGFIEKARRKRKQLGAGMRQVGILAAAGIVALNQNVERLQEDHRRLQLLANGLKGIAGIELVNNSPKTNMLFFDLEPSIPFSIDEFIDRMKAEGVLLMNEGGKRRGRLLTHYWISDEDIAFTLRKIKTVMHR